MDDVMWGNAGGELPLRRCLNQDFQDFRISRIREEGFPRPYECKRRNELRDYEQEYKRRVNAGEGTSPLRMSEVWEGGRGDNARTML